MKRSTFVLFIIFLVLLIDQSSKIWVKLNMALYDEIVVFDWFRIHFTENPGMAFGIELGGDYGKLALSLFRIIAVFFITFYLGKLIKSNASKGLLAAIALILAGAVGNILDSMFYGVIFSESSMHAGVPAVLFPEEGGYASFLHGKVVDMLYFPLVEGHYPEWVPWLGGDKFQFFQPVFNIADTAISIGVVMIILFYKRFFNNLNMEPATTASPIAPVSNRPDEDIVQTPDHDETTRAVANDIDEDVIGDPSAVATETPDDDDKKV